MANVVDGDYNYPCTVNGIDERRIFVTMAGDIGYNAVCTGLPRNGNVQDNGIQYNIRIPGSFGQIHLQVTFRRR